MKVKKFEDLNESYDPWKTVTYIAELDVSFENFIPAKLKISMIFESDDEAIRLKDERIKEQLKPLTNLYWYQIKSFDKAPDNERILPMC